MAAEEQAFRNDDANQGAAAQDGPGPSSNAWQGDAGWGMNDMARPDSSDFTLAAELLGLPTVSQGFTAKARLLILRSVRLKGCLISCVEDWAHQSPSPSCPAEAD